MGKSKDIGKQHVLDVYEALVHHVQHPTAVFIKSMYDNIIDVKHKFQTERPDAEADLTLMLATNEIVKVNLFTVKGNAIIQPKNLGAQSFLEKYFDNAVLQEVFNYDLRYEWKRFYEEILKLKSKSIEYDTLPDLRKKVKGLYPKFTEEINPFRNAFLAQIRDIAFQIMADTYNSNKGNLEKAFKQLMMLDTVNIISRRNQLGIYQVEQWQVDVDFKEPLQLYKKGNNTIGFRIGKHALTIRFKFESSPSTSIKLATSFDYFPEKESIERLNLKSIQQFEQRLATHEKTDSNNKSNAIGKCNEAIVYYRFLKEHPTIEQVDDKMYGEFLEKYSPILTPKDVKLLVEASMITVEKMVQYLNYKYGTYTIKSIELVPDSYLKDRLDSADLRLILMKDGRYKEEGLSLKATASKNPKITVKNPGAGTILGSTYFNIGSLTPLTDALKVQFNNGEKTHHECLEIISAAFGEAVKSAPVSNIQQGLAAMIGKAPKVITNYKANQCQVVESKLIAPTITVFPQTPGPTYTMFKDRESDFELTLRVKFSGGHQRGWTSIKFAGETRV